MREISWTGVGTVGNRLTVNLITAFFGALDHIRALAIYLAGAERIGTSQATIGRGAVEALARGWWLLKASGPDDLVWRVTFLERDDLSRLAKIDPAGSLQTHESRTLDADDLIKKADEWAAAQQLGALTNRKRGSGPTARVDGMMSELVGQLGNAAKDRSRFAVRYYHDLSGAAHSMSHAVAGYLNHRGPGPVASNHVHLEATRSLVIDSVDTLIHVSRFVHNGLAALSALDEATMKTWNAEHDKIFATIRALRA
ncbi:hypothetical protein GCM10022286_00860 [Gryllotalpicola daejeonensis]|uniref:Uncharacterized protein n=2 Tax=Gryllotalpicola daejeonensis TaxID=993087 RepID=A0ABP7ZD11_9MICO